MYEPKVNQSSGKLESPYLFNIIRDPKGEEDVLSYNTWVMQPMMRLRTEFQRSLKNDPAPPDPLKELYNRRIDVLLLTEPRKHTLGQREHQGLSKALVPVSCRCQQSTTASDLSIAR